MSRTFIDTNIWLYAVDPRYPDKRDIAQRRIAGVASARAGFVSPQVIAEFACAALAKLRVSPDDVKRLLGHFDLMQLVPFGVSTAGRAIELQQLYRIAFWDALIVASAERAGCTVLLSEDLNPGQSYSGVKVENPFVM